MANETNKPATDPAKADEQAAKAKADADALAKAQAADEQAAKDQAAAKEREDALAAREKALEEREQALAAASAPQAPVVQVVPGQNFNMQNALQQDANARARKLKTNEVATGPVFRVPVTDPLTGQVAGWKMVNGRGERVADDTKKA
jgi:hypothetical protein